MIARSARQIINECFLFQMSLETNPDPDPIHKTSPKVNPVQHAEKGTRAKVLRDGKPLFVVLMKTIACLTNESRSNFGLSLEFLTTHSNLAR